MSLAEQYLQIKAATDFWLYLLVWSAIGQRPAWIGSKYAVKRATRLMLDRKRAEA